MTTADVCLLDFGTCTIIGHARMAHNITHKPSIIPYSKTHNHVYAHFLSRAFSMHHVV